MKKKIANQISLPIVILTIIAIGAGLLFLSITINQMINEELDLQLKKADESFGASFNQMVNNSTQLAAILSTNPNTKSALKAYNETGDLENSVQMLKNDFLGMNNAIAQADYKNFRIHYHTKDIHSLYRTWTEKRGDDISFRKAIKKCVAEKKPIEGIEAGRGGVAIRGIMPVLDDNSQVLGSVENYFDITELLKELKIDTTHESFAIFIHPEIMKIIDPEAASTKTNTNKLVGSFFLHSSTGGNFKSNLLKEENLLEGSKAATRIFKNEYAYSINPLPDFEGNSIGSVVYQYDASHLKSKSRNLLWLFAGMGTLFSFFIFFFISLVVKRNLGKPMDLITNHIEKISQGDLTGELKISTHNEIKDVADNLNTMTLNLKQIVGNILEESNTIAAMSQKINDSSVEISNGSSNQAVSIEEVCSSMEEISSNMHLNYENAKQTEQIAIMSAKNVKEGNSSAGLMVESMDGISEKISIINDIAFQTNILALNAAVEAARAGDHGRGFAVVASEVRKLAERSKVAASDISSIITNGVNVTQKVGTKLGEIVPEIEKTANLVQEIAASTQEINSGSTQVNKAMQQLNDITQANAANAEEMAQMSIEMAEQAEKLKKLVLKFKM